MNGNTPTPNRNKIYTDALLAGAIGGIAPNLMRMVIAVNARPRQPITDEPIGYAITMVVLAMLGAFVVWIWQEKRLKKAFYLGIGLPALVQVAGLQQSVGPKQTAILPFSFIASAYAAVPVDSPGSGRHLAITPRSTEADFAVLFFGQDEQQISAVTITRSEPQVLDVPEAATTFAIRAGSSISNREALPTAAGATINVVVEITVLKGSGFLQALGFERSGAYDIRVRTGERAGALTPAARAQFLNSVRNVQQKLRDAGVFAKDPDGVFGEDTANAVGAYQTQQSLKADRVLGARTLNKLVGESAGRELVAAALQIELALKGKGLLSGQPNGALGPSTISATRAFQRQRQLLDDGALGKDTLDVIFSDRE